MITKYIKRDNARRGSFSRSIDYILGKGDEPLPGKVLDAWWDGVIDLETAALEMAVLAADNHKAYDVVAHLLISYAKDEKPSRQQMKSDVLALLKALDMDGHQYVAVVHGNTDNLHIHIVCNRIGADLRCARNRSDYAKREKLCTEISASRGWKIVHGYYNEQEVRASGEDYIRPPGRPSAAAYMQEQRTGEVSWAEQIKDRAIESLRAAGSWEEAHRLLARLRIAMQAHRKNGEVTGLSFHELKEGGHRCKASAISHDCRYRALEARFGAWSETTIELRTPVDIPSEQDVTKEEQELNWVQINKTFRAEYKQAAADQKAGRRAFQQAKSFEWKSEQARRQERRAEIAETFTADYHRALEFPRGSWDRATKIAEARFKRDWDRRASSEAAKRRWADTKLSLTLEHAAAPVQTFRQFIEEKAQRGDVKAEQYLAWMVSRTMPVVLPTIQAPAVVEPERPLSKASQQQLDPIEIARAQADERVRQSFEPRLGWSSPEHEHMMGTIRAYSIRLLGHLKAQFDESIRSYRESRNPAWRRVRAAADARLLDQKLHFRPTVARQEATRAIKNIVDQEICQGTERQFYDELMRDGWGHGFVGKAVADWLGEYIAPPMRHPELTEFAQRDWSKATKQDQSPDMLALAAMTRLATAQAREEPDPVVEMHEHRFRETLSRLTEREWTSFSYKADNQVKIQGLSHLMSQPSYKKRLRIFETLKDQAIKDMHGDNVMSYDQTHATRFENPPR